MSSHSLPAISDNLPPLQDNSSSGAGLNDPDKGPNVKNITGILCTTVRAQGSGYATIDRLPRDVLLEIFSSCQTDDDFWSRLIPAPCTWLKLVHVCRRWRQIVFGSPRHLDLQLLCTHRTPVRKNLGVWPPFPILVKYGHDQSLTYHDQDNLFAALEHADRICHLDLSLPSWLLSKVAAEMQEPFPTLKHLRLLSDDGNVLIFPDGFLGGAAPRLQRIALGGIVFPALPTLLSSSVDLVSLNYYNIPQTGYISPLAMVAHLASLPRLEMFSIGFQSIFSRPDPIPPSLVARTVLPSLIYVEFKGVGEYLEQLVSQIDCPRLNQIHITYMNRLVGDFQLAQPLEFVGRSEDFELTRLRYADVTFTKYLVSLEIYRHPPRHPNRVPVRTSISCQGIDWQVPHITQVLSQLSTILSHVVHLKLEDEDCQLEIVDNADWLELLRQFSAVQTLHVSRKLAGLVVLALEDVTEKIVADSEVLPALNSICLVGQPASSVNKFVAVRRFSGRPVTVVNPEMLEHADMLMKHARVLYENYEQIMRPIDRTLAENRITLASDIRRGIEDENWLAQAVQANRYSDRAQEALETVKRFVDEAIENRGRKDGLLVPV